MGKMNNTPREECIEGKYTQGNSFRDSWVQAQVSFQAAIPKPVSNETNKSSSSDTTVGLGIFRHCSAGKIRQCLGVFYHVLSWVDFLLFSVVAAQKKISVMYICFYLLIVVSGLAATSIKLKPSFSYQKFSCLEETKPTGHSVWSLLTTSKLW